ncbi:hypothetical protein M2171_002524 [Bradyrhizobium japonicum USDA 38]|jgi:hypothetical protein|nr:hypothetical protein [Bradyrhizobium japonicum USDA 38]MCS3945905.1 hypothetical protein [Bradyrhizobium japonicum]
MDKNLEGGTARLKDHCLRRMGRIECQIMQNFANAAFPPDTVAAMTSALHAALATLPEPVHSAHVNILAESILRTAKSGERDTGVLKRIALMELQLTGRA